MPSVHPVDALWLCVGAVRQMGARPAPRIRRSVRTLKNTAENTAHEKTARPLQARAAFRQPG
jgi:hypothetical protein